MSEANSPIHIILTSENLKQFTAKELNALTRELAASIKGRVGNEDDILEVDKSRLPQDAKVADLLVVGGQILLEIAPTLVNHVTPWILGKIDETIKAFSARKGKPISAKVLVGNHEEVITPKTTEAEIDTATERIKVYSEASGDRVALVIGNSTYVDPALPRLNSPAEDAQRFANVLKDPNVGAFTSVKLLIDKTKDEIEGAIEEFYRNKRHNDLLLLYYSGHGIKSHTGKQLFLTAKNTTLEKRRASSVADSFILENMKESGSERQILILDCCFGAAIIEGAKGASGVGQSVIDSISPFESIGHGHIIIAASNKTQYAHDGKKLYGAIQNSLFTQYLIKGLEEGLADNDNDGKIEIKELYDYVLRNVRDKQTPVMNAHLEGEIVIGINPKRKIRPAELPEELQVALRSKESYTRLGAIAGLEHFLNESSGDKAAKEAVRKALQKIIKDDENRKVFDSAQKMYTKYFESTVVPPAVPEPLPQTKSATPSVPGQTNKSTKSSNLKIFVILISILILMCVCSYIVSGSP